jgi:hypothetical protein
MALLPLCRRREPREDGCMSTINPVHQLAALLGEMNYAVRRLTELRMSRELGFGDDEAPATYTEFLLRTSVARVHEPSAGRRAAGRPVR